MSTSLCTACLSRLRLSAPTVSRITAAAAITPNVSSFHSSAAQYNVLKKKSNAVQKTVKMRESRSARIKKKNRERPKPPPVGERKAQRKRIVLSNTNALEVQGLQYLSEENMGSEEALGRMLALEGALLDQLRDSKAFKTTQNWNMFRQPSTLMRKESIELGQDIADVNASRDDQGMGPRIIQKVIDGERGSGKSIHLLQAMSMGFLNDWIVINVPEAHDFVNNQSSYAPAPKNDENSEQLYNQPHLASELLARVVSSNAVVLSKLKMVHKHSDTISIKKHSTLKDLAQYGAEEPSMAPAIFSALWKELTVPSSGPNTGKTPPQARPSILVTIDGLNHWMAPTKYRNSDHKFVHAHQFTLIRHFLSLLFNSKTNPIPQGGMVLAATSGSNSPSSPSFDLLLSQLNAAQNQNNAPTDKNFPLPAPFSKQDQRVLDLFTDAGNTGLTKLNGLTKGESKGLLEYFARSGILRESVTDGFISQQWGLSGGGVIGEICKLGKRLRV